MSGTTPKEIFRSVRLPEGAAKPGNDPAQAPAGEGRTGAMKAEDGQTQGLFDFERQKPQVTEPGAPGAVPRGASREANLANRVVSAMLVAIVWLAPVPLASNRPIFWMIWSAAIFLTAAVYLLAGPRAQANRLQWTPSLRIIMALAAAFAAFAILQSLPPVFLLADVTAERAITVAPSVTLLGALRWSAVVVFGLLAVAVTQNRERARRMAWGVYWGVVAHAVYGLLAVALVDGPSHLGAPTQYTARMTGFFVNPNSFATFLGMGACLGLALLSHRSLRHNANARPGARHSIDNMLTEGLKWFSLAMIVLALLATASRMGVFATAAGAMLTVLLMTWKHAALTRSFAASAVLVAVGVIIIAAFAMGTDVVERSIFLHVDSETRLDLYAQTLELIRLAPLYGSGLDTFEMAFHAVHRPPVSPDLTWDKAHSTYLTLWAEMGLIAGSIPPLICLIAGARLGRMTWTLKRDFVLPVAGLGCLLTAAIHSTVDFSLEIQANVFLFVFILAIALPAGGATPSRRQKREEA